MISILLQTAEFLFENVSIDGTCSWFRKFQIDNNIRQIRFHDLRHTHASILLYKKVDIKTISDRLGNSNIETTVNTCIHIVKELNQKVSEIIDKL